MLGALIGAGASLLGGWFGQQSMEDQQAANRALQLQFAKNAIQWRVEDAKKAGIHPVYAMGAPSISPAVSVGGSPLGEGIARAGQDISRAVSAGMKPEQQVTEVSRIATAQDLASRSLGLENQKLQNELLRSRLAQLTAPGVPPGETFPVPEAKKVEERPPLMAGGYRWKTTPWTSPIKAWSDQYGDEGPMIWAAQGAKAVEDAAYNAYHLKTIWDDNYRRAMGELYRRYAPRFMYR